MSDISPVIITGGAQRLGLDIAERLIESGYKVLVTYRSDKPGVKTLKSLGAECIEVDFSSGRETDRFIHHIKSNYPSLRAIVHNASSWLPEKQGQSHNQTLRENFNIHMDIPYTLNLELESLLYEHANKNAEMSDVIHMTDYVVERGSKKHIAYAASKAALANMTLSLAARWAPSVKVNNVAPALLMFNEGDDKTYREKVAKKSLLPPAPGAGEASDIILTILNSQYITGRTFALDGGRHIT